MSPTAPTAPLTHLPETQNKAQPGSEHPTRHRAAPKANRPTGRNPNTQPAPPFHMRPNGETTTIGDHRGSKQDREDHLTQKMRHGPAPTARSHRHVTRPGSPPFEPQSSPTPPWRKHPQPPPPQPPNQTVLCPKKRADAGLQTADTWQTPCQIGTSPEGSARALTYKRGYSSHGQGRRCGSNPPLSRGGLAPSGRLDNCHWVGV